MAERLYRSMRNGRDERPEVGRSARTLGVRPGIDILVQPDGTVVGGAGGMSVAPDSRANLPRHRLPPEDGEPARIPCGRSGRPISELISPTARIRFSRAFTASSSRAVR